MQDSTRRLIRFAIGLSLIAVSGLGNAVAHSQVEQPQVIGQETLTNRAEPPVSETNRLSDHQQLKSLFSEWVARQIKVTNSHSLPNRCPLVIWIAHHRGVGCVAGSRVRPSRRAG